MQGNWYQVKTLVSYRLDRCCTHSEVSKTVQWTLQQGLLN
jgi:hypothetical protein